MDGITTKDAMVPLDEYTTISHKATLYDAIQSLDCARQRTDVRISEHRSVIILDDNGKVVGKLTYRDILRGLEPRYDNVGDVEKMERFGLSKEFITFMRKHFGLWEGSFQDLCQKAVGTIVEDILEPPAPHLFVDADAPIVDAVHQLMVGTDMALLVTSGDDVVGILRLIDAFHLVCEEIKACKI